GRGGGHNAEQGQGNNHEVPRTVPAHVRLPFAPPRAFPSYEGPRRDSRSGRKMPPKVIGRIDRVICRVPDCIRSPHGLARRRRSPMTARPRTIALVVPLLLLAAAFTVAPPA